MADVRRRWPTMPRTPVLMVGAGLSLAACADSKPTADDTSCEGDTDCFLGDRVSVGDTAAADTDLYDTDIVPPDTDIVPPDTDIVPPDTDIVPPDTDLIPPQPPPDTADTGVRADTETADTGVLADTDPIPPQPPPDTGVWTDTDPIPPQPPPDTGVWTDTDPIPPQPPPQPPPTDTFWVGETYAPVGDTYIAIGLPPWDSAARRR